MRILHYILDEKGEPKPATLDEWVAAFESGTQIDETEYAADQIRVSTVFLGLNHNFRDGPPVLWETMIFASGFPDLDRWQTRCAGSREQALAMHQQVCKKVEIFLDAYPAKVPHYRHD